MNVLDLFSGIGGFSLGLERAGMRTAAFCEIEPYCRAVLRKHWPETPIYEDVRTLDATRLRTDGIAVDVICGGFPCQPWSVAGARKGDADDRHLWPEMLRIIRDIRPRWVIGENVPGLDDKRCMALDRVLADLEGEGYQGRPFEIPACAVDAPHKRSRLFIVANRERGGCGGQQAGAGRNDADGQAAGWQQDACGPEHRGAGAVANSQRPRLEELRGIASDHGPQQQAAQRGGAVVDGAGHGWGQGRAGHEVWGGWDAASGAGGVSSWSDYQWIVDPEGRARRVKPGVRLLAHGVPGRTHQIRALGNSIVPQIAQEIGRAILAAERVA